MSEYLRQMSAMGCVPHMPFGMEISFVSYRNTLCVMELAAQNDTLASNNGSTPQWQHIQEEPTNFDL
jgi:hypothetical protein